MRVLSVVLALALGTVACGPSPDAAPPVAPSGTLVVVLREGAARVPFQPKVARILRANEQLTAILGHSIQIEIDGSLLPQDHEGAQDVIARLVEDVARQMDALRKEEPAAFAFAKERFERLVVRYAPTEAAERQRAAWIGARGNPAKLDVKTRTIDVVQGEARWMPISEYALARELHRAHEAESTARYERTPPESLPASERAAWVSFHEHERQAPKAVRDADPYASIGTFDAFRVRGMITVHALATREGDAKLAQRARAYLVKTIDTLGRVYLNERAASVDAPPGSSFRQAEAAYLAWLRAELPRMSHAEKTELTTWIFAVDNQGRAPRDAPWIYPGIDRMAFVLGAVDEWIRGGHPASARGGDSLYEKSFCPLAAEADDGEGRTVPLRRNGTARLSGAGRCETWFYRWVSTEPEREAQLADAVLARKDARFTAAVAHGMRSATSSKEGAARYVRFMRRFEGHAESWRIASGWVDYAEMPADLLREELRRIWRTSPPLRSTALLFFGRQASHLYPEQVKATWADFLQGTRADDSVVTAYFDEGELEAFDLTPAVWPAFVNDAKRTTRVTKAARALLDRGRDGRGRGAEPSVTRTLAIVGGLLCAEHATTEVAELRAFAQGELTARPGAGFTDVLEATEPNECNRRAAENGRLPRPRPATPRPDPRPDLFPPKPPLMPNELPGGGGSRW